MSNYQTMEASDGNYLVVNGVRYPVINSWVETEGGGRKRWGIVTEGEMHAVQTGRQPERAGASVAPPCTRCDGTPTEHIGWALGHLYTARRPLGQGPTQ